MKRKGSIAESSTLKAITVDNHAKKIRRRARVRASYFRLDQGTPMISVGNQPIEGLHLLYPRFTRKLQTFHLLAHLPIFLLLLLP